MPAVLQSAHFARLVTCYGVDDLRSVVHDEWPFANEWFANLGARQDEEVGTSRGFERYASASTVKGYSLIGS